MKQLATIICLVICMSAKAQKKDSIPPVRLTDTTAYLSVRDINDAVEAIKDKITAKQYESWQMILGYVINTTSKEWEEKNKKK